MSNLERSNVPRPEVLMETPWVSLVSGADDLQRIDGGFSASPKIVPGIGEVTLLLTEDLSYGESGLQGIELDQLVKGRLAAREEAGALIRRGLHELSLIFSDLKTMDVVHARLRRTPYTFSIPESRAFTDQDMSLVDRKFYWLTQDSEGVRATGSPPRVYDNGATTEWKFPGNDDGKFCLLGNPQSASLQDVRFYFRVEKRV